MAYLQGLYRRLDIMSTDYSRPLPRGNNGRGKIAVEPFADRNSQYIADHGFAGHTDQ